MSPPPRCNAPRLHLGKQGAAGQNLGQGSQCGGFHRVKTLYKQVLYRAAIF